MRCALCTNRFFRFPVGRWTRRWLTESRNDSAVCTADGISSFHSAIRSAPKIPPGVEHHLAYIYSTMEPQSVKGAGKSATALSSLPVGRENRSRFESYRYQGSCIQCPFIQEAIRVPLNRYVSDLVGNARSSVESSGSR